MYAFGRHREQSVNEREVDPVVVVVGLLHSGHETLQLMKLPEGSVRFEEVEVVVDLVDVEQAEFFQEAQWEVFVAQWEVQESEALAYLEAFASWFSEDVAAYLVAFLFAF